MWKSYERKLFPKESRWKQLRERRRNPLFKQKWMDNSSILSFNFLKNVFTLNWYRKIKTEYFHILSIFLIKKIILWYSSAWVNFMSRQSIFLKIFQKELFRKNAVSQDSWFFSISLLMQSWRRKGMEYHWNEKCLQAGIKTNFVVVFNGFHFKNSKQKGCPRFPWKKKIKFKKTNVTLPNTSR